MSLLEEGGGIILEGTIIDITERKRLEVDLARAKSLEAIGMITGGVAHEVRNPSTPSRSWPRFSRRSRETIPI